MAGLRVDEHAVDAERIDLPLPPGAGGEVVLLPAADAVARVAVLEHQALDAARARFAAQLGERGPVGAVLDRREVRGRRWSTGRCGDVRSERRLEQRAALVLRPLAQVLALPLEQVVGDEADRRLGEHLLRQRLAADALLQQGERRDAGRRSRRRSRRRGRCRSGSALASATISGKRSVTSSSPRDQIQTSPGALDDLGADAVVLPFDDPVGGRREPGREVAFGQVERMGEEERIRLADVERADVARAR